MLFEGATRGRRAGCLCAAVVALAVAACSSEPSGRAPSIGSDALPEVPSRILLSPRALPAVDGDVIAMPGGGEVHLVIVGGRAFVPVEGTLSTRSYDRLAMRSTFAPGAASLRQETARELGRVLDAIGANMRVLRRRLSPGAGYFAALVPLDQYAGLRHVDPAGHEVLLGPIVSSAGDRDERAMAADRERGLTPLAGPGPQLSDFGGLARMNVDAFRAAVAGELGEVPDGSLVKLGIVDTGITYGHPALADASGASRVEYMRDFTGEGRIYFLPDSIVDARRPPLTPAGNDPNATLVLTAEVLVSPTSVSRSPDPNKRTALTDVTIQVPPALRSVLLAPGYGGARMGVFSEKAFARGSRKVDLDQNGKTDDLLYAIYVPGHGRPDSVYLDVSGRGDFRGATPLTSFELSRKTARVAQETIGLEIREDTLLDGAGADVPVVTASVVGFDPGNHGSHVAGIAAARKIIQNAPDDSLRGVAPAARLMSGRVCANTGGCRATEAIIALAEAGAEVINMSIGSLPESNDGYGVQETVINRLTMQHGTVFVVAASNDGPGRQTVGSPSVASLALSVAATATPGMVQRQYQYPGFGKGMGASPASEDYLLYFSSRGPSAAGGLKPDVAAPGTWLSAIQLNAAPGAASGLGVMWGTSMASPAAAGAVAMLLDAAKRHNMAHPAEPLATDGRSLRRAIVAGARPFDVTRFEPATGAARTGQYTFVDEGVGMIDLVASWEALKRERDTRVPRAVTRLVGAIRRDVDLSYEPRVLAKNPNGLAYDGSRSVETVGGTLEARFGRGVWVDPKETTSLYRVQIARRLPTDAAEAPDALDSLTALRTTADELEIETVIHGSHVPWVRAGVSTEIGCVQGVVPQARTVIVGEGAIDVPVDPATGAGGSLTHAGSAVHVCVDRGLLSTLPPGDHGALVYAYRAHGAARETVPSFVFPVYVTVPSHTLAGQTGYHFAGDVSSFGVDRHYVDVPTGTTTLTVRLQVPAATQLGNLVTDCASVSLEALEGGNTLIPPEFAASASSAVARSCGSTGRPSSVASRTVTLSRVAPRAGSWDLHVFGMYSFRSSPYSLDVEFARLVASKSLIDGDPSALVSTFDVDVVDASVPISLSAAKSRYTLAGFAQRVAAKVAHKATTDVPRADGTVARAYGADVAQVVVRTSGFAGNDLDLEILECADATLADCARAASSAGPDDREEASFKPKAGKVYVARVEGYAVKKDDGAFTLVEELKVEAPESGTVAVTQPSATKFTFDLDFPVAASAILSDARFTSKAYAASGGVDVRDAEGSSLLRVDVRIAAP
jgi:hypothetical protein